MKATPKGWPRLSTAIYYDDAAGRIEHSELVYGEALVMVAQSGDNPRHPKFPRAASPRSIGGANTQSLMLFVDNVVDHCARARAAGATVIEEPAVHDYGADYWSDRSYGALDTRLE